LGVSAELLRRLVEEEFVDKYHWLPQEIDQIPYKWIQEHYIIRKAKSEAIEQKRQVESIKKGNIPKTRELGGSVNKPMVRSGGKQNDRRSPKRTAGKEN